MICERMMKLMLTLFFALFLGPLSSSADAQLNGESWICMPVASGGLAWKGGHWMPAKFDLGGGFVLESEGELLTNESVATALNGSSATAYHFSCRATSSGFVYCGDTWGQTLFFNKGASKGGISKLFGATMAEDMRDTLNVQAFECAKD